MVPGIRTRRAVAAVFAVYLVGVARLTLWPEAFSDQTGDSIRTVIAWLTARGLPVTYAGVEAAANVALFVPFGVLAGLLVSRRRWWVVLAAGCATSAAIETSQLLFLPTRVATVQDVVLNALGTALGLLVLARGAPHLGLSRNVATAPTDRASPARPRNLSRRMRPV